MHAHTTREAHTHTLNAQSCVLTKATSSWRLTRTRSRVRLFNSSLNSACSQAVASIVLSSNEGSPGTGTHAKHIAAGNNDSGWLATSALVAMVTELSRQHGTWTAAVCRPVTHTSADVLKQAACAACTTDAWLWAEQHSSPSKRTRARAQTFRSEH